MAYMDYYEAVQEIYLAYYGRAADQDGLAYWSVRLDEENGNLDEIIEAFANSEESQKRYGDLGNEEKISSIYQSLFGRDTDDAGLNYYLDQLETGQMTQATIMLDVLNGARGNDLDEIDSFVSSAMAGLDTEAVDAAADEYADELPPQGDNFAALSNGVSTVPVETPGGDPISWIWAEDIEVAGMSAPVVIVHGAPEGQANLNNNTPTPILFFGYDEAFLLI